MREQSAKKVRQVMELMKMLHLRVEAKERVNEQGFIENTVFWVDDEKYPVAERPPVPEEVTEEKNDSENTEVPPTTE